MGIFSLAQIATTAGAGLAAAILSALVTNKLATRKSAGDEKRSKLEGAYVAIEELINVVEHITYRCETSLGLLRGGKDSTLFASTLGDIRALRDRSITLFSKIAFVSETYLFPVTLIAGTPRREFSEWMDLALLLETRIMQAEDNGFDISLLIAGSQLSKALIEFRTHISQAALISLAKPGKDWPPVTIGANMFGRSNWWRRKLRRIVLFFEMKDPPNLP